MRVRESESESERERRRRSRMLPVQCDELHSPKNSDEANLTVWNSRLAAPWQVPLRHEVQQKVS